MDNIIVWWPGGWTPNKSIYELFGWFWVAYTLKLLKPSGASLASLGVLSSRTWCLNTWTSGNITKIAQGCQPLILNHDTIPYQWFQALFRCRNATLNISMGFNHIYPYMDCVKHKYICASVLFKNEEKLHTYLFWGYPSLLGVWLPDYKLYLATRSLLKASTFLSTLKRWR